jgi:hypothetical protein
LLSYCSSKITISRVKRVHAKKDGAVEGMEQFTNRSSHSAIGTYLSVNKTLSLRRTVVTQWRARRLRRPATARAA